MRIRDREPEPTRVVMHADKAGQRAAVAAFEAAERARLQAEWDTAKHLQRLDMQHRLHGVVASGDGRVYVASRWDLAAYLDPGRSERLGRVTMPAADV